VSLDLIDLSSAGSAFHTAGPAKENARSTNLVRVRGLMKVILKLITEREGWYGEIITVYYMETHGGGRLSNLSQIIQLHLQFMYSVMQRFNHHQIFSLHPRQLTSQLIDFPC